MLCSTGFVIVALPVTDGGRNVRPAGTDLLPISGAELS